MDFDIAKQELENYLIDDDVCKKWTDVKPSQTTLLPIERKHLATRLEESTMLTLWQEPDKKLFILSRSYPGKSLRELWRDSAIKFEIRSRDIKPRMFIFDSFVNCLRQVSVYYVNDTLTPDFWDWL
ncbi:hypothetical protein FWF48_04115 [Candidatus Saccharibacteria bacterium]|nr:hypothetical protein [Candidatus Saccharibacteria bacterium]